MADGPTHRRDPSSLRQSRRNPQTSLTVGMLAGLLLCTSLVIVGFPLGYALVRCIRWVLHEPGQAAADATNSLQFPGLLMRTFVAVGAIGVLACLLAIPAAWLLSRGGKRAGRIAAFVAVPLMLPNYLAYAGWGLVRGPRTVIGDWLASGTNLQAEWKTTLASHFIAVWGLALWAWPLAAYVLALFLRRITPDILDSLRLDGGRAWRRSAVLFRLSLSGLLSSIGLVMLVMLGSVVPLDVAQVETFSIHLLRLVTQRQYIEEAWIAGWPVYVVAAVAAVVMSRRLHARAPIAEEPASVDRSSNRLVWWMMLLVWGLAVVAPMGLFLHNMREPPGPLTFERFMHLSRYFWRECLPAIVTSASVGGVVAGVGVGLMLVTWLYTSHLMLSPRRAANGLLGGRAARAALGLTAAMLLLAGLLPGTLIGSAVNRAWNSSVAPFSLDSSLFIVVFAHLARFGFVAFLLGWWLARQESAEQRDLRQIDGATGVSGWFQTCLAAQWPALIGTGVLMFVLSFHEIEATVQVQQPGQHALAQQLLDWLHMARDENLAAAAVNLLGLAGGLGLAVGWLLQPRETQNAPRS